MTISVEELDAMPAEQAADALRACCGASRWVQRMVERRPYQGADSLHATANDVWREMTPRDWIEAFAHHPRIGEREGAVAQDARGATWSAVEQSGVADTDQATRDALAAVNREYEAKFGTVFIVSAADRSAEEMLTIARARLGNEIDVELSVAAEEQRKIMQLRLQKLLGERP